MIPAPEILLCSFSKALRAVRRTAVLGGSIFLLLSTTRLTAQSVLRSRFDTATASFRGDKGEQALYLLRPVQRYGHIDAVRDSLPPLLDSLMRDQLQVDREALRRWLTTNGVSEQEIGGSLDSALCRNRRGDTAKYFVIHDTSYPYYGDSLFPADIDSADFAYNQMQRWARNRAAHAFVGRTGASVSPHDFGVPWRATKLELKVLPDSFARGLFLHIELVQPRRRDSLGTKTNDAIAPDPGFTRAQYRCLAVLYIAAGVRRGEWLVPAFHAVLDEGIKGAHDDPQGFELEVWVGELRGVMGEMAGLGPR